jgi:Argonaute linker 1 domain
MQDQSEPRLHALRSVCSRITASSLLAAIHHSAISRASASCACCAARSSSTLLALPSHWAVVPRCVPAIGGSAASNRLAEDSSQRLTLDAVYCCSKVWLGYQQSLRACEMGLTLNVDVASTAFIEEQTVMTCATGVPEQACLCVIRSVYCASWRLHHERCGGAWQVPTLLARAAGMREEMLNNGLSGHQYRAANKAVSGLKVSACVLHLAANL